MHILLSIFLVLFSKTWLISNLLHCIRSNICNFMLKLHFPSLTELPCYTHKHICGLFSSCRFFFSFFVCFWFVFVGFILVGFDWFYFVWFLIVFCLVLFKIGFWFHFLVCLAGFVWWVRSGEIVRFSSLCHHWTFWEATNLN